MRSCCGPWGLAWWQGWCWSPLQGLLLGAALAIAPASAAVEEAARLYLGIRIWGAPATVMLYAVTGWLIAVERTRAVLVLQVVQNGLNVVLDVAFVLHLGWGVAGVAGATLLSEYAGLVLGLWLLREAFGPRLAAAWARLRDPVALRRMFGASRDIMLRSVILQLSFTSFIFLAAGFGDVTLAANHVLLQFLEITAYGLDGFAFAAETLVGQAVGAKAIGELRRSTFVSMQWGFIGAALLGLVFALAGGPIIALMTTAPEVRAEAARYLPWLVAAPLIGVGSWIYDGVFIGALRTGAMLRAMLVSVVFYALALAVLGAAGGQPWALGRPDAAECGADVYPVAGLSGAGAELDLAAHIAEASRGRPAREGRHQQGNHAVDKGLLMGEVEEIPLDPRLAHADIALLMVDHLAAAQDEQADLVIAIAEVGGQVNIGAKQGFLQELHLAGDDAIAVFAQADALQGCNEIRGIGGLDEMPTARIAWPRLIL